MPPVMEMRAFLTLSSPPQVVHFIPMTATPKPATTTMILTIMRARVAWRAPGQGQNRVNPQLLEVCTWVWRDWTGFTRVKQNVTCI